MIDLKKYTLILTTGVFALSILISCNRHGSSVSVAEDSASFVSVDSVASVAESKDTAQDIKTAEDAKDFMTNSEDADEYEGSIIPVIADASVDYARKLLENEHNYFIVVDKASMRVILYDRYGKKVKSYGMACARNYGTKHKKADSRTPEGFFSVEGVYNSTDWLYTDDYGRTSKAKGVYGPKFIRLKIPVTSQIGIHGTSSPGSIGRRASHGCIRLTNDNILDLAQYAEAGMPVIVLPGKKDRAVNRKEGYSVPFFATSPEYAASDDDYDSTSSSAEKAKVKERVDSLVNSEGEPKEEPAPAADPVPEEQSPAVPVPDDQL